MPRSAARALQAHPVDPARTWRGAALSLDLSYLHSNISHAGADPISRCAGASRKATAAGDAARGLRAR